MGSSGIKAEEHEVKKNKKNKKRKNKENDEVVEKVVTETTDDEPKKKKKKKNKEKPAEDTVETESKSKPGFPKMLIVSPTRELAMQSQEVLEAAGKSCGVRSVCVYGGVPKWTQKEALKKGVEVVVA